MWPFRRKTWTEKQKRFRKMCREDEKEMERLVTFYGVGATGVACCEEKTKEEPSTAVLEALKKEFVHV